MCIQLNSCCCFELRTGTIIIGILELVFNILYLLSSGSELLEINQSVVDMITPVFLVLEIIAAVLLIFGAIKERTSCISLWLIIQIISIALLLIDMIVTLFKLISDGELESSDLITTVVAHFIVIALSVYFLMIVRSYQTQLTITASIV